MAVNNNDANTVKLLLGSLGVEPDPLGSMIPFFYCMRAIVDTDARHTQTRMG